LDPTSTHNSLKRLTNRIPTSAAMRTNDKFPWELLKAECLRLVCGQLIEASSEGQTFFKPVRKEDMVAFLHDVHARGVLKALQDVEPPKKTIISTPQATPSKRKSFVDGEEDAEGDSDVENEEGYNTRYKGVKRVKVHGPSPEPQLPKPKRARKSVSTGSAVDGRKRGRPRKNVSSADEAIKVSKGKGRPLENGEADGQVLPSISRPRGRPRKNVDKVLPARKPRRSSDANAPKSKDSARAVFDGILLVKRPNGKGKAVEDDQAVLTGNDSEEDAVVAVVNGDAHGDLSSLGGSNKENEKGSTTYTPEGHHEADLDADGEFEADADVEV